MSSLSSAQEHQEHKMAEYISEQFKLKMQQNTKKAWIYLHSLNDRNLSFTFLEFFFIFLLFMA